MQISDSQFPIPLIKCLSICPLSSLIVKIVATSLSCSIACLTRFMMAITMDFASSTTPDASTYPTAITSIAHPPLYFTFRVLTFYPSGPMATWTA